MNKELWGSFPNTNWTSKEHLSLNLFLLGRIYKRVFYAPLLLSKVVPLAGYYSTLAATKPSSQILWCHSPELSNSAWRRRRGATCPPSTPWQSSPSWWRWGGGKDGLVRGEESTLEEDFWKEKLCGQMEAKLILLFGRETTCPASPVGAWLCSPLWSGEKPVAIWTVKGNCRT